MLPKNKNVGFIPKGWLHIIHVHALCSAQIEFAKWNFLYINKETSMNR
jgi:hypothetical protein